MTAGNPDERAESLRAIEREVGVLIRRVRRVIRVVALEVHPELQPATYLMLAYLYDAGTVRSTTVVDALGIDKGAVSRQIQHLVDLGLVDRTPDPSDGRATLLAISAAGLDRLESVRGPRWEAFDVRLGDWSPDELASFARQLGRYNRALDDDQDG
ncbi:MAG TPA: MarR family transcriptional regulator [Nocardioides sp.]|nr:MarR family transcriptional regulator [Nocardioides sp.]